jgi:hypothetical protein
MNPTSNKFLIRFDLCNNPPPLGHKIEIEYIVFV